MVEEKKEKELTLQEKHTFGERLAMLQEELKAPKGQYNSFGKYAYRSAEDILNAVKPLNLKYGFVLTITDELVQMGDRYYIRAIATLQDTVSQNKLEITGIARESESKKGMDSSQVTGATSSYARKYALNGLYLIDDTKDADTNEYRNEGNSRQASQPKQSNQQVTEKTATKLNDLLLKLTLLKGQTQDKVPLMQKWALAQLKVDKLENSTEQAVSQLVAKVEEEIKKLEEES